MLSFKGSQILIIGIVKT